MGIKPIDVFSIEELIKLKRFLNYKLIKTAKEPSSNISGDYLLGKNNCYISLINEINIRLGGK